MEKLKILPDMVKNGDSYEYPEKYIGKIYEFEDKYLFFKKSSYDSYSSEGMKKLFLEFINDKIKDVNKQFDTLNTKFDNVLDGLREKVTVDEITKITNQIKLEFQNYKKEIDEKVDDILLEIKILQEVNETKIDDAPEKSIENQHKLEEKILKQVNDSIQNSHQYTNEQIQIIYNHIKDTIEELTNTAIKKYNLSTELEKRSIDTKVSITKLVALKEFGYTPKEIAELKEYDLL